MTLLMKSPQTYSNEMSRTASTACPTLSFAFLSFPDWYFDMANECKFFAQILKSVTAYRDSVLQ